MDKLIAIAFMAKLEKRDMSMLFGHPYIVFSILGLQVENPACKTTFPRVTPKAIAFYNFKPWK